MRKFLVVLSVPFLLLACDKSSTDYVNNPNAPDHLHNRPVGSSARDLLSSGTYSSLKIEILYMPGYQPQQASLDHLQAMLGTLLNKTTIQVVTKEIPGSSNTTLSVNDVQNIEKNHRTAFTSGNEIAVCILYTNGNYSDANTLGVAYKNTSAAMFGKKIHENSGGIGQASRVKLEATILEHEFAHLLGLVDLGSTMQTQHKDAVHGNHCNNSSCLMYYAAETTDILGILITGNIPSLDANCKADLTANGGK